MKWNKYLEKKGWVTKPTISETEHLKNVLGWHGMESLQSKLDVENDIEKISYCDNQDILLKTIIGDFRILWCDYYGRYVGYEEPEKMKKITIPEILPPIKKYYQMEGNCVGGNLHIVLDDGNIEDCHIEFCIREAKKDGDALGVEIGRKLLQMSKSQRRRLTDGYEYG